MSAEAGQAPFPTLALPSHIEDDLEQRDAEALLDLIVRDEDRVPRNVIDAAARLRDATVAVLENRLVSWEETEDLGQWWLGLHAVMILGLIPTQSVFFQR